MLYTGSGWQVPPRPRKRRAGYRAGQLSPQLRAAITAEATELASLAERLAVIEAVGEVFAAMDDALEEMALPRLVAVAALRRQGWSYDRIARETKLSKGRVAQLARAAKDRRL